MGTSFFIGILIARQSGKELFGEYSYILALASLFSPLCIMGLNNITTKYVTRRPENSHFYIQSILYVRSIGALLSIFAGYLFIQANETASQYQHEILVLLAFQFFQFLYVFEFYFLAKNRVLPSLSIRLMSFTITTTFKIIVIFYDLGIFLLITAHGLNYVLTAIGYAYCYYHKGAHLKKKKAATIQSSLSLFHKGKWLLLSGAAALVYLKIDQIMLGHIYGMEEVAIYAAAVRLSEFWYVFPVLIANAYYPEILKRQKESPKNLELFISKILGRLFSFALLLSFISAIFADWLVVNIYDETYLASGQILSIHIFATCFIFQRAFYSKWLISNNLFKYSLYSQGVGALINIMLNIFLIPNYGAVGAAWGTVISYTCASYFSLFLSTKTKPFAKMMTKAMLTCPLVIQSVLVKYFNKP